MKQFRIQIGFKNKLLNKIRFSDTETGGRVSRLMDCITQLMNKSKNYQLSVEPN